MSCPTCDHTMELFGYLENAPFFHCPRCGTIRHGTAVTIPFLVGRCKLYYEEAIALPTDKAGDIWRRYGIAEAINVPTSRSA